MSPALLMLLVIRATNVFSFFLFFLSYCVLAFSCSVCISINTSKENNFLCLLNTVTGSELCDRSVEQGQHLVLNPWRSSTPGEGSCHHAGHRWGRAGVSPRSRRPSCTCPLSPAGWAPCPNNPHCPSLLLFPCLLAVRGVCSYRLFKPFYFELTISTASSPTCLT